MMSVPRLLLCVVFPPLAVMDKGCAIILIVLVGWVLGWIPGVLLAIAFGGADKYR